MTGERPIKALIPVDLYQHRVRVLALIELMYSLNIVNPPLVTCNNVEEKILPLVIALMEKLMVTKSS
jgi:hypothetical protein